MLTFDDTQFLNVPTPDVSADEARALVLESIERYGVLLRAKFMRNVSPFEAASWPLKANEAAKFSGDPAATPILAFEAQQRGIELTALVAKVLTNAQQLAGLEAMIAGTCGKHRDAVKLLTTAEEVFGYDWRDGWPG